MGQPCSSACASCSLSCVSSHSLPRPCPTDPYSRPKKKKTKEESQSYREIFDTIKKRSQTLFPLNLFFSFAMPPSQTTNNMSASYSSPPPPPPPPSSPRWLLCYMKLRFFARIRRFLRSKAALKRCGALERFDGESAKGVDHEVVQDMERERESEDDSTVLQKSVKKLHFGSWKEKENAAKEIERLSREDGKTRKLMAELGVIPVLVAMVASEVESRRRAALTALIELANGTYT